MKNMSKFPGVDHVLRDAFRAAWPWVTGVCAALLIIATMVMQGCSAISVTTPDGYSARYSRLGNQDISGLRFEKDKNGLYRFALDKQSADDSGFVAFVKEWLSR